MATINTNGSQTATISTEHTLATVTDSGAFCLVVDTNNMAIGDELTLRIYGKVLDTDVERIVYESTFAHNQIAPLKESVVVLSPHHFKATLEQTAGTGRVFDWAIYAA